MTQLNTLRLRGARAVSVFTLDHEIALVAALALRFHRTEGAVKAAVRALRERMREDKESYSFQHKTFEEWLGSRDIIHLTKTKCAQLGASPGETYGAESVRLQ